MSKIQRKVLVNSAHIRLDLTSRHYKLSRVSNVFKSRNFVFVRKVQKLKFEKYQNSDSKNVKLNTKV